MNQLESKISKALSACRSALLLAGIFTLCVNLLMLTVPIYLFQVFDRVLLSGSLDTLIVLSLGALIALAALAVFEALRRMILTRIGLRIETILGGPVLAASLSLKPDGENGNLQGLRDINQIRSFVTGPVLPLMFDALLSPLYLVIVYFIHPLLGALALLGGVLLFFCAFANQKLTSTPLQQSGFYSRKAMFTAENHLRNAGIVHALGMAKDSVALWGKDNAVALQESAVAGDRNTYVTAASKFIRLILQIGLLGGGAYLVINNELTTGMMMAASIIAGKALAPVEGSIEGWRNTVFARQAYKRLKEFVVLPDNDNALTLSDPAGQLTVEKLSFYIQGQQEPILSNISFVIEPGESVAVIGPTAAGKTTLAKLIVGGLPPSAGCVRLDGMDIRNWSREQLGAHLGYQPQNVELFPGSVSQNIARMKEDADDDKIVEAARLAGVEELISNLPKGYQTVIGIDGEPLSGGQKQRIALARAFFGEPKLVILDEPDANLDEDGTQALIKTIAEASKQKITVVAITQRATLLRHVDKILMMRDGQVVAFGERDEILSRLMDAKVVRGKQKRKQKQGAV